MKKLAAEKVEGQTMAIICRLFGKSWQAYYQHGDTLERQLKTEEIIVQFILEIRQLDPGIGGEKLQLIYQRRFGKDYEYMVGRTKMEAIISKYGPNVRKRIRKPRTTDSSHGLPTWPNLIKELIPVRKNQVWVTDITYIPIWLDYEKGTYIFCYLTLITDYYTKEIIGWSVGDSLETKYCIESLEMALDRLAEEDTVDLILHSDRGTQFVSYAYTSILLGVEGIRISMTENSDPKDNAVAERENGIMKNELLKDFAFRSIEEVRKAVRRAVEFNNNERPHLSLDNMTPAEAAKQTGRLKKRWRSYREEWLDSLQVKPGATTLEQQTLDLVEQAR